MASSFSKFGSTGRTIFSTAEAISTNEVCLYYFLFYLDHVYMIGGVTRLGGLPGLPGRVTLSAGVTICHVNVLRWGNPPSWGRIHSKKLKSETCLF